MIDRLSEIYYKIN